MRADRGFENISSRGLSRTSDQRLLGSETRQNVLNLGNGMKTMITEETTTLKNLLAAARRHPTLIVSIFGVVFALAIVAAILIPPDCTSQMEILVRPVPPEMAPVTARPLGERDPQISEQQVNSEVELLSNTALLQSVVTETGLVHPRWFLGESDEAASQRAVRRLAAKLKVSAVRNTSVIQVRYADKSPEVAAAVMRAVEAEYLAAHVRALSAPGAVRFFTEQSDHYRQEVERSEASLAYFDAQQKTANLDQQSVALTQTLSEQRSSLQQTEASLAEARMEMQQAERSIGTIPQRLSTTRKAEPNQYAIDHLTALLAELKNRRTLQSSRFLENDPIVRETDDEIRGTEEALALARSRAEVEDTTDVNPVAQILQQSLETKRVEAAGLAVRQQVLRQQIQTNQYMLDHLGSEAGARVLLAANVQLARDSYSTVTQRREQARVSDLMNLDKIVANVAVVVPPTESTASMQSRLSVNLGLGLLLAIFISMGVVLLADYFQPSLRGARA